MVWAQVVAYRSRPPDTNSRAWPARTHYDAVSNSTLVELVATALEELVAIDGLGHVVTHHVVRGNEKDSQRLLRRQNFFSTRYLCS